jgi:hypothetical protein
MKSIETHCGQNTDFLNFKAGDIRGLYEYCNIHFDLNSYIRILVVYDLSYNLARILQKYSQRYYMRALIPLL